MVDDDEEWLIVVGKEEEAARQGRVGKTRVGASCTKPPAGPDSQNPPRLLPTRQNGKTFSAEPRTKLNILQNIFFRIVLKAQHLALREYQNNEFSEKH